MKISDAYEGGRFGLSFELFPPKSIEAEEKLWRSVERLEPLAPDFVSVTYGAGGSTRDRTARVVDMVRDRTGRPVAHHLTCVGASRGEIDRLARGLHEEGVSRIVALRGDLPEGQRLAPDGYGDAADTLAQCDRPSGYTDDAGDCDDCEPGYFCATGSVAPAKCAPGTNTSLFGAEACGKCPAGTFQKDEGQIHP